MFFANFLIWATFMIAPFGSWESPLTTDLIVADTIRFNEMQADDEALYWIETHPKEKGRSALIRYDGRTTPIGENSNVRSRVHEYGGGSFCLSKGKVIFSKHEDQQLYILEKDGTEKPLTKAPDCRFADGNGGIWVCEKHGKTVENLLVRIDETGLHEIASGHDFYSSPRVSSDGKKLAFITWDFPYMQWDSSTVWLADIGEDGQLHNLKPISGGPDESVCCVQWSPEGVLHFVSDKTKFWNLYRFQNGRVENLCNIEAEFGTVAWSFGRSTYTFLADGKIICMYAIKGVDHLGLLDPKTKTLRDLKQPFTSIHNLVTFKDKVYFFGATPTLCTSLICYDPKTNRHTVMKQIAPIPITPEWISEGQILEYPAGHGKVGYAFYYPPKNPNFSAPKGEAPPLIVNCHGGPTGRCYAQFILEIQYWTTRGFAFVDVNYGGSSGYGREYLKRLEGKWGIVDVEDCISAAKVLVEKGLADPKRLLIRGGSAGGYTTLAALAFHDIFAAGTSYYGVSDLELLFEDTHKFEARYTDLLIGTYPEQIELIRSRSPINYIENISKPVLLLQGEEDKVVLPNQSERIYDALKKRNIPVGMILFPGEDHGFRQAASIKRALDAELYFYSKVLNIELSKPYEQPPVEIAGL